MDISRLPTSPNVEDRRNWLNNLWQSVLTAYQTGPNNILYERDDIASPDEQSSFHQEGMVPKFNPAQQDAGLSGLMRILEQRRWRDPYIEYRRDGTPDPNIIYPWDLRRDDVSPTPRR